MPVCRSVKKEEGRGRKGGGEGKVLQTSPGSQQHLLKQTGVGEATFSQAEGSSSYLMSGVPGVLVEEMLPCQNLGPHLV